MVLIHSPSTWHGVLRGQHAVAPKTGGPNAQKPVTEQSWVERNPQGNQGPPSPGHPAARQAGPQAVGLWAGEPVVRWAGRRAFLGASHGVEPSGPGFIRRQLKKEESHCFRPDSEATL